MASWLAFRIGDAPSLVVQCKYHELRVPVPGTATAGRTGFLTRPRNWHDPTYSPSLFTQPMFRFRPHGMFLFRAGAFDSCGR